MKKLTYLGIGHIETVCWELARKLFHRDKHPMPLLFEYHDRNRMEYAVDAPRWDYYTTTFEKAGNLGFSIITGHPLRDGNKRCGMSATIVFLLLNGHILKVKNDEMLDTALKVATHEKSKQEFINWLEENSTPFDIKKLK